MKELISKIISSNQNVSIILGAGMTMWLGYPDFQGLYFNILKMLLNHDKITLHEYEVYFSNHNSTRDISKIPQLLQEINPDLHSYILNYIDNNFYNIDNNNIDLVNSTAFIENKKFKHLCNISKKANILTTNYDRGYENFAEINNLQLLNYTKLHGDLESKKILFKYHYESFMFDEDYKNERELVRNTLKNDIVIYLGYSFNDKNMKFLYDYGDKENIYLVTKNYVGNDFYEKNIISLKNFNNILPILSQIETSLYSRDVTDIEEKYYYLALNGMNYFASQLKKHNNLDTFDLGIITRTQFAKYSTNRKFNDFAMKYFLTINYDESLIGYQYVVNETFVKEYNKVILNKNILLYLDYLLKVMFYVNNPKSLFNQIKNYKNYYKSNKKKNLFKLAELYFYVMPTDKNKNEIIDLFTSVIEDLDSDEIFSLIVKDHLLNMYVNYKQFGPALELLKTLVEQFKSSPKYLVIMTELYFEFEDYNNAKRSIDEYFKIANSNDSQIMRMKFYQHHNNYCLARTYEDEYSVFLEFKNDNSIIKDSIMYVCWYNELVEKGFVDDAYEMLFKAFELDPTNEKIKVKVRERNMGTSSRDVRYRSIKDNFDMLNKIRDIEKNNISIEAGKYYFKLKNKNKLYDNLIIRFRVINKLFYFYNKKLTIDDVKSQKDFRYKGIPFNYSKNSCLTFFTSVLLEYYNKKYKNVIKIIDESFNQDLKDRLKALLKGEDEDHYDYNHFCTIIAISYFEIGRDAKTIEILSDIEDNYYALVYYGEASLKYGFVPEITLRKIRKKLMKARNMRRYSLSTNYMLGIIDYGLGYLTQAENFLFPIRTMSWMSIGHKIHIYYKLIICAIWQGMYYKGEEHSKEKFKEYEDRVKRYLSEIKRCFKEFDEFNEFDYVKINNLYGYGYFFKLVKTIYWLATFTNNIELVNYVYKLSHHFKEKDSRYKNLNSLIDENYNKGVPVEYKLI